MIGMTKTISLAIILCLCIIPLDIDLADLYIGVVLVVCAIISIYVGYWSMKNKQDPVDMHYLLNCNNTLSE